MDSSRVLFPEIQSLSFQDRDRLPVTDLRDLISKYQLASFPLQACHNHDVEGLSAVAEQIRAVAAEWPSCGIALCMHYNVVIALHRMPIVAGAPAMFDDVISRQALVASAFSEFLPERGIFSPTLRYEPAGNGQIALSGTKKPCTLSSQADYLVVSCRGEGDEVLRVGLIPRSPDMQVDYDFYKSTIFGASDTHAIVFDQVVVPASVLDQTEGEQNALVLLNYGMSLFNILIGACYSGIATSLYQQLGKFTTKDPEIPRQFAKLSVLSDVMLKNMIRVTAQGFTNDLVTEVLVLRYQLENALLDFTELLWQRLSSQCILGNLDVLHLINTCRMFKYHPMTEKRFIDEMLDS